MEYDIKEALEFMHETGKETQRLRMIDPQEFTFQGRTFVTNSERCREISQRDYPKVEISTLKGAVDSIVAIGAGTDYSDMMVVVESSRVVSVVSRIVGDARIRDTFVEAVADTHRMPTCHLNQEDFIIAINTCFEPDETTETLIKIIGSLKQESSVQQDDDGMSSKVLVRDGIISNAEVTLKNPVTLTPRASFHDVDNIEREYILRIHKGLEVSLVPCNEEWEPLMKANVMARIKALMAEANIDGIPVVM